MHIVIMKERKKCSNHKMPFQNFFDINIIYYNVRQNISVFVIIITIIIEKYVHIIPNFHMDIFAYFNESDMCQMPFTDQNSLARYMCAHTFRSGIKNKQGWTRTCI